MSHISLTYHIIFGTYKRHCVISQINAKTQLLKFRQRRAGGSRVCLTGVRSTGTVRRPRPQLYHIDKPGTGELWYKY